MAKEKCCNCECINYVKLEKRISQLELKIKQEAYLNRLSLGYSQASDKELKKLFPEDY